MAKKLSRNATRRRKKSRSRVKSSRARTAEISGGLTTDNIGLANSNATLSGAGAFQRSAFQSSAFDTGKITTPPAPSGRVTFQGAGHDSSAEMIAASRRK